MADFEQLQAIVEKHRRRVAKAGYVEAKVELAEQLYPLLSTILEAVEERLHEDEAQIFGLIEQTLSVIQPTLATQLITTLGMSMKLVEAVEAGSPDAKALAVPLRAMLQEAENAILDVTVEGEGEDEGDEEDEEEEADDEEPTEAAPAETPTTEAK